MQDTKVKAKALDQGNCGSRGPVGRKPRQNHEPTNDLYPIGNDALHHWAFPQRRPVEHGGQTIHFASPEYVILRKLEYFREGGFTKHLSDIRAMLDVSGESLDRTALIGWINRLGLQTEWQRAETAGN